MSFPPFILPCFTVNKRALMTAVQSVVQQCNIAVYLHSKKLYFHSIYCASCNKHSYLQWKVYDNIRISCMYLTQRVTEKMERHSILRDKT